MHFKHARLWQGVCALVAAFILPGCDYPDKGYYALIGLNHTGEQVVSFPFMVEEITDDSTMTTGFMLLLPKNGVLIEVPIHNSEDTSRRSWDFAVATEDSQAGSLEVSFSHYNGLLRFSGQYQATPFARPWPIGGKVSFDPRSAWLEFNGGLPYLHQSLNSVFSFELVHTSPVEFEITLGCPVNEAVRVNQLPVFLIIAEGSPAAEPKEPRKPRKPPRPPSRQDSYPRR